MKTSDALFILGDDRVNQLFLQETSLQMSNMVRYLLQTAEFFYIPAEKLAKLLHDEVIWQKNVHDKYREHIAGNRKSISDTIRTESQQNLFDM